jgi:hypothetical protein
MVGSADAVEGTIRVVGVIHRENDGTVKAVIELVHADTNRK